MTGQTQIDTASKETKQQKAKAAKANDKINKKSVEKNNAATTLKTPKPKKRMPQETPTRV